MSNIANLIKKEFWQDWHISFEEAKKKDVYRGFSGLRFFITDMIDNFDNYEPLPLIFLSESAFQEFISTTPQNENEKDMILQHLSIEGLECIELQTVGESYRDDVLIYADPIKEVFFFKKEDGNIYSLRNYICTNGRNISNAFFTILISNKLLKKY